MAQLSQLSHHTPMPGNPTKVGYYQKQKQNKIKMENSLNLKYSEQLVHWVFIPCTKFEKFGMLMFMQF